MPYVTSVYEKLNTIPNLTSSDCQEKLNLT